MYEREGRSKSEGLREQHDWETKGKMKIQDVVKPTSLTALGWGNIVYLCPGILVPQNKNGIVEASSDDDDGV